MKKRVLTIVLTLMCIFPHLYAVAEMTPEQTAANSGANIDVVLVVDCSGSMPYADPDRLALQACKLFVDICDRATTRVGYVAFSHRIISSMPLTAIATDEDYEAVKKSIDSIKYTTKEDTDIALALTEAQRMMQIGSREEGRNPLIIFLSDGNTDIGQGKRTEEAARAEMEDTIFLLDEANVPVYSIGLNYDGNLNLNEMQGIANGTNGESFEATDADQLTGVLKDIYSRYLEGGDTIHEIVPDGDGFSTVIPVANDSILQTNITILMRKPIKTFRLYAPQDIEVKLPSDKFLFTSESAYAVIKMLRPEKGEWKLYLEGEGIVMEDISVTSLSSYEMRLQLQGGGGNARRGQSAVFEARLIDGEDTVLEDTALMDGADAILFYQRHDDPRVHEMKMTQDGAKMTATLSLNEVGRYTVWAQMQGVDASFSKVSNTQLLEISAAPLTSKAKENTIKRWTIKELNLDSPLANFPFVPSNTFIIPLTDVATWDRDFDSQISVNVPPSSWVDFCTLQWSPSELKLVGRSTNVGSTEADIELTDAFGNTVRYNLEITCISIFWILGALLAIVVLLAAIIIGVRNAAKPSFNGSITVGIIPPQHLNVEQPAAVDLSLRNVSKKKPVSLTKIVKSDRYAVDVMNVLTYIEKQASKTIISPNRTANTVKLSMRHIKPGEGVLVNGREFGGKLTEIIASDRAVKIDYPTSPHDDSSYVRIELKMMSLGFDEDTPVNVYDPLADLGGPGGAF